MKKVSLLLVLALMLSLTACGNPIDFSITKDAVMVNNPNMNEPYLDPAGNGGYVVLIIGERSYIAYGAPAHSVNGKHIGPCIAYNSDDLNQRYYSVVGSEDLVCSFYCGGIMEPMIFWRALDTMGQDIFVPKFITVTEAEVWGE